MGTFLANFIKDPDSTQLYGFDFAGMLATNAYREIDITGFDVIAPAEITVVKKIMDGAKCRAYLGGGLLNQLHTITFRLRLKNPAGYGPDVFLDKSLQLRIQTQ